MSARRLMCRVVILVAIVLRATFAQAQSQVRVTEDRTTIWQPGFQVVADVVNAGTTLTVVGKRGNFYEVELARPAGAGIRTGFVAVSRVTPLDNAPLRASESAPRNGRQAGSARRTASRPQTPTDYMFRVFGQAGYGRFTADETFTAVMGRATAPWFGGGIQVGTARAFVEVAVDRYQDTGRRVFVFDDQVFDLGSDTTVRIVPVTVSFGYRFWQRGGLSAYASGGLGGVIYRETSPRASEDENVDDRFATYQAVIGTEVSLASRFATAFEFQYSTTPKALEAGVGSLYDERDLGAMQVRVKLLFGR